MQLVLLDTNPRCTYTTDPNSVKFFVEKRHLYPGFLKGAQNDPNCRDEEKLRNGPINEIQTHDFDLNSFKIILKGKSDASHVEIRMEDYGDGDHNAMTPLGQLWNRFQEKVKVSLYLEYGVDEKFLHSITAEGMRIDPQGGFVCKGPAITKTTPCDQFVSKIKLVAHINDNTVPERVPFAQKLLEKESFSDVIITVGNGAEIKGHKAFLSVCSPVLEAMLRSEMEESQTGRLDMTDLSEEGVRAFLRYVYYSDLKDAMENNQVAYDLLYAGHKYDVPTLEADMTTSLMGKENADFDVTLAFKIYMFVRSMDSGVKLKAKCLQVMKGKLDELESVQEYRDLFEKPSNSKTAIEVFKDFARP